MARAAEDDVRTSSADDARRIVTELLQDVVVAPVVAEVVRRVAAPEDLEALAKAGDQQRRELERTAAQTHDRLDHATDRVRALADELGRVRAELGVVQAKLAAPLTLQQLVALLPKLRPQEPTARELDAHNKLVDLVRSGGEQTAQLRGELDRLRKELASLREEVVLRRESAASQAQLFARDRMLAEQVAAATREVQRLGRTLLYLGGAVAAGCAYWFWR